MTYLGRCCLSKTPKIQEQWGLSQLYKQWYKQPLNKIDKNSTKTFHLKNFSSFFSLFSFLESFYIAKKVYCTKIKKLLLLWKLWLHENLPKRPFGKAAIIQQIHQMLRKKEEFWQKLSGLSLASTQPKRKLKSPSIDPPFKLHSYQIMI